MHHRRSFLFLLALTFLLLATHLNAQVTTATLYGVIRDATGAVAPAANVTVTNQGTNLSRTAVSDERGEFALPALPAGRYTVRIELAGFKTYTNEGLQLGAGETVRQTFELEVGQVSENVTVEAATPLVETASAAQKESLGTQQVTELPLSRRNLINLVTLAPGAADASVGIGGEWEYPAQRGWRRRQHHNRGRHRRRGQPGNPRYGSIRRPKPDQHHERRSGGRSTGC